MIPKKLTISNFQSYGEEPQELDFERFRIACLTGANAAGKSSLIEAMGWCIWGKGRTGKEGLINENADEMQVSCVFETSGKTYRILRKATRKKSGGTTEQVDLHIFDPDADVFQSQNENTLRLTQKKILDLVGLDYDGFISSSFISQGRSNEFTLKSPKERKEILAQILRIDRYAVLAEKAKEKARTIGEEITYLAGRIGTLRDDLSLTPTLRAELKKKSSESKTAEKELTTCVSSCTELEQQLTAIKGLELEQKALKAQLASIDSRKEELVVHSTKLREEEAELRSLVDSRDTIEQNIRKFNELKKELSALEHISKTIDKLRQESIRIESVKALKTQKASQKVETIEAALHTFDSNLKALAEKIENLQADRRILQQLRDEQRLLETSARKLEEELDGKDHCVRSLSQLESRIQTLVENLEDIKKKGLEFKGIEGTICPLCHSTVNEAHKEKVLEEYRIQYRNIEKELADNRIEKKQFEALWRGLEKKQQELSAQQKRLQTLHSKRSALDERLKQLEELDAAYTQTVKTRETHTENLLKTRKALTSGAIATEELRKLSEIDAEIVSLGYSPEVHNALKTKLETLSDAENRAGALGMATLRLEKLTMEHETCRQKLDAIENERKSLQSRFFEIVDLLEGKPELTKKFERTVQEKKTAENKLRHLLVEKQTLKKSLDDLAEKEKQRKKLSAELSGKEEIKNILTILQDAFGIKGIQSLLIENAVPQLEEQANSILGKLTQNQMAFEVRTQKQRINKNITETLEIAISDSQGEVRDYESFSGGEKFRIDLSLRIALSKLLSIQTGHGLKLLVIDEGFGTQDEDGLDAIIDSIHRITDEFEKIVLITHLEKLKDAFEVKIVVSRQPEKGSTFSIVTGDRTLSEPEYA
ncbi:AAA family ATPase [Prosthecochloris sp. SCSIO W1103]|uniref:AAA family ATPase n=1 Tax=Prosthecochloris sp. SCSIO W1103 TaxID=2992244 RepID=UPI00223CA4CD|nr:SMC family ATPase [Prosthecochloris sp. SCSIO W1103]UZJ38007.1 SMC family ATPase [Prosthecochloris sp. SCSIO W1103]